MVSILLAISGIVGLYAAWNIGSNDMANSAGPGVGSGALSIKQAVLLAAIFEFAGAVLLGGKVAGTLEHGIINTTSCHVLQPYYVYGMLSSLMATGFWLQLASLFGWPVSTTHSIVGAVIGFGLISTGGECINWGPVASVVISWGLSPALGACISYFIFIFLTRKVFHKSNPVYAMKKITPGLSATMICLLLYIIASDFMRNISPVLQLLGIVILWFITVLITKKILKRVPDTIDLSIPEKNSKLTNRLINKGIHSNSFIIVEQIFAGLQAVIACFMAFAHGSNDIANAIAPVLAIFTTLKPSFDPSKASILFLAVGGLAIVLGLIISGWKVIATIGTKITELTPSRGFSAGFGAAITIVLASRLGLPISTTHVVVGAVLGVGFARGIHAINLSIVKEIIVSWVITVPAGAVLSIIFFMILKLIFNIA